MIFVIGWCVRRTRDADGREQVDSARGCPTSTRIDVRDFIRRHTRQLARVTCVESSSASRARSLDASRHARRGTVERDGLRRGSRSVPCDAAERAKVHQLQRPRVRPRLPLPPSRRALSRRGTLNRARDAEPRDVDARLLSRPSAGTPSVSFAMRFTRTRVWWVRTRRRRSPGPRRTSSSSSDRRRCTSSSAASSRASSTPSTAKREVRRSAAKRDAPNRR